MQPIPWGGTASLVLQCKLAPSLVVFCYTVCLQFRLTLSIYITLSLSLGYVCYWRRLSSPWPLTEIIWRRCFLVFLISCCFFFLFCKTRITPPPVVNSLVISGRKKTSVFRSSSPSPFDFPVILWVLTPEYGSLASISFALSHLFPPPLSLSLCTWQEREKTRCQNGQPNKIERKRKGKDRKNISTRLRVISVYLNVCVSLSHLSMSTEYLRAKSWKVTHGKK